MKKFICLFILMLITFNVVFGNIFSSRIAETEIYIPTSFSNNSFSFNDIFVKDLVVDLEKNAEAVPDKGFDCIILFDPHIFFNLNIHGVSVGTKFGATNCLNVNISKDMFNFWGKGYSAGDTLEPSYDVEGESILYVSLPVDVEFKRYKLNITPSVFLPLAKLNANYAHISFSNDNDGNIKATLDTESSILISSGLYDIEKDKKRASGNYYYSPIEETFKDKNLGFDLSASFEFPVLKNMNLLIASSFPVLPGKITQKVSYHKQYTQYDGPVMDLIIPPEESNDSNTSSLKQGATGNDEYLSGTNWESVGHSLVMEDLAEPFFINRPLKLSIYTIYEPIKCLSFVAGGGICVRHPFDSCKVSFYPEYYASATFNLFDVIKASVSTEYTNQLFKHQVTGVVNLRLVELDVGLSMEASNFLKSFNFYGIGGSVALSMGF